MICRLSTTGMSEHPNATALALDALGSTSRAEQAVRCLQGADRRARRGTSIRRYVLKAQPCRLAVLTFRDRQCPGSIPVTGHAMWPTAGPRNPVITRPDPVRQASAH